MKKLLMAALLTCGCVTPDPASDVLVHEEYTDENGTYILHIEYVTGEVTHIEITKDMAENGPRFF